MPASRNPPPPPPPAPPPSPVAAAPASVRPLPPPARLPPPRRDEPGEPRRREPLVVLGVSGSIAAYKAAEVARLLVKGGARVVPVLSRSALEFVGAATFSGITGERAHTDMFGPEQRGELHVELGARADAIVFAPATADLLARLASGRSDDLLTALALSARGPLLAAPAMHPRMWSHPATQRNVATLASDGRVELVGPVSGEVASGETGVGRMADPETIAALTLARVGPRDLEPMHVVVTAGPTCEDIDPVRFLGNRSSGKMGFAIAERALRRGALVTLIAGPVSLPTPPGVRRVDVRSAEEMRLALDHALGEELGDADLLVMAAAVADYRPKSASPKKLRRGAEPTTLELDPNPDLLAAIGARRRGRDPVLVGFAVDTESDDRLVATALNKLEAKRVDMVVANHAADAFGRDDNRVSIVTRAGVDALGILSKLELADRILDRALSLLRR
jgi:phosphopantothenoylcysteine decarboxylase/phosphopantothenate--cysteine ligase